MASKRSFTVDEARGIGDLLGINWAEFDVTEFRKGLEVELEHGAHDPVTNVTNDDPLVTGKIAWAPPMALAQEHFTEGPVWECSGYRTKQGHFDDYMKYLRQNFLPQTQETKKAGLVRDQKVYLQVPANPTDPDVMICTLHASFGKALDYDATDDTKTKDIAAKHYKTADEQKQRDTAAKRFEFRDFLGSTYYREVNLKPMP